MSPPPSGSPRRTGRDPLVRKAAVAPGPLAAWVNAHLAESFDYACVESVADLAAQSRAVTRAGQVKHSAQRHEKDDRRHVDDRSRWVLGFDNEVKIAGLRRRLSESDAQIAGWTAQLASIDADEQQRNAQLRSAQTVLDAQWSDIDTATVQTDLDTVVDRIARWEQDNPEHSILSARLDAAAAAAREAAAALTAASSAQAALGAAQTEITRILTRYLARWEARGGELRAQAEYVDDALAILSRLRSDGLPQYENRFFELLNDQSARNIGEIARAIRKAPADIRARIEPVNASLRHSPFDVDRWLKITVREHRSPVAAEFLDQLGSVSGGAWTEDDRGAAESRFVAMSGVLDRLGSSEPADRRWRTHVLDTRLHVRFIGVEFDADGEATNYHDSSAGLSGGQA